MEKKHKNTNIIFNILKIFFLTVAIIIVLVAGIIIYKANANPDKVPDIFGYKPMIVLSGSMETSIYTGDLVFVKIVDTDTFQVGDIVAFRNEKNTVTTHRIIEIVNENGQTYFRTKGDANNAEDANLVSMDDVEGIYIWRIAGFGNFLMFMKEPIGLILVLLVILVVGLLWLYLVNKKDEKKQKEEDEKDRLEFEEFKKQRELEKKKQLEKEKDE